MHGLTRVRAFTQDDAHLICRPDQLETEILGVMAFVTDFMELFGFEYSLELSTRPDKSIGSDEDWERATAALTKALIAFGQGIRHKRRRWRLLRPQDRLQAHPTPSSAPGNAPPSSATSPCPSASS